MKIYNSRWTEQMCSSIISQPQHYMQVNGQLHTPAVLSLKKDLQVLTK